MKLRYTALLATTILFAGCAATNTNTVSINKAQQPQRQREAAEALPLFIGNYAVTDSRHNYIKATSATLALENNIPVMSFLNADGKSVLVMSANNCAGDIKNKFSGTAYLSCSGEKPPYGGMPNLFSVSEKAPGHIQKIGSMLFSDDMVLKDGFLISFYPEGGRAMPTYLSVRREP